MDRCKGVFGKFLCFSAGEKQQKVSTIIISILLPALSFSLSATNYIDDGYMDRLSYNPGETAHCFINATANYTNHKIFLCDANNHPVDSVTANLFPQCVSPSNTAPWENGFGYTVSFNYVIPANLPSGIYNWEQKIYFIIKSATKDADITLIYPTNTEAAYNNAGGKSLYNSGSTNNIRANAVSFQRPLTATELSYNRMYADPFVKWITALGAYNFQMIADQDLDDFNEIQHSKIIVIVGHSEYWTRVARQNFDTFVNNGRDAVVLSGNTMWWQVRYSGDKTKLICYKDASNDTITNPLLKTVNWTVPSLNYPILTSIGVDYEHGVYPPSTISSYHGWGGYKILAPYSPLLTGTGLNFHDTLSCQTREYDGALFSGFNALGDPVLDTLSLGFCKMELIGYDCGQNSVYYTPYMGYGTFIAFKKDFTSGNIINTASCNWCANAPGGYLGGFGGPDSSRIEQISINIFNLLLAHANIFSSPNSCTLTTSLDLQPEEPFVALFPNPTSGKITVHQPRNSVGTLAFELYNSMGQMVLRSRLDNSDENMLDISDLPDGSYYYLLRSESGIPANGTLVVAH